MFYDILNQIKKEAKHVGIYTNLDDTSSFLFGKISYLDPVWFAIEMILPDGRADGILMKEVKYVFRIEIESKYAKKMERLISKQQSAGHVDYMLEENRDVKQALLNYARENERIISIKGSSDESFKIVGFVLDIYKDSLKIAQVNEYGYGAGEIFIDISDIAEIRCDSVSEKIIYDLWESNTAFC